MSSYLKVSKQCVKVVKIVRYDQPIFRIYRTSEIILPLCKALVRTHLECCAQALCSYFKTAIELLKEVQHRATKLMTDLRDKKYEDRLRALHPTTLETRRIRRDLIEIFKIMKGLVEVDCSRFFSLSGDVLHVHSIKLFKSRCRSNLCNIIFSNKVVDLWNDLYKDDSINVDSFKNKLDNILKHRG